MTELSRASQLALDLGRKEAFAREDLVVTPSNTAAIELIDHWPHWPGTVAIITGPHGSGKTHMANAWALKARAVKLDVRSLQPLPDAVLAVLIDPLSSKDASLSETLDETGLFHLINSMKARNGHILMTSLSPIGSMDFKLADLRSRLLAANIAEIHLPDDALLSGLIAKAFADRQIKVEPDVIAFLMQRIERSASAAGDIVSQIDVEALARNMRISKAFVAQFMKKRQPDSEPMLF